MVAAGLWGILPIALKELLAGMDATTIVWYRFLAAGIVLAAWLSFKGNLPNPLKATAEVRWILVVAALGLCANYSLFSQSLNYVNGETSEAVIQLTTLFLILGGVIFYKEPFDGIQKLGTAFIVFGLVLFFHDRLSSLTSLENKETIGILIVFVAAVTWTVYALLQKRLLKSFASVQILFLIYGFSVFAMLPFISPVTLFQLSGFELALLGFCCLNTLIAYGCFAEALNLWDASKVSAVLALAPLFTIGTLKLIVLVEPSYAFSDRLTVVSLVGASFLVVGSVLAALMPVIKHKLRQSFG